MKIHPYRRSPAREGERGIVMILTLVFATVLSALAYSAFTATEANIAIARQDADALRAELAAQSGLVWGQRALSLDGEWTGTGLGGVEFADDCYFTVALDLLGGEGIGQIDLLSTGEAGDGYRELAARLQPLGGGFQASVALGLLGGDDWLHMSTVVGDVLVVDDAPDRVWDWVFDGDGVGAWELGGPDSYVQTRIQQSQIFGSLHKFTAADHAGWPTEEFIVEEPHLMPSWDLNAYLTPDMGGYATPGTYKYISGTTHIKNQSYYKPVVIFLEEGEELYLNNCDFWSGVIVHCPEDWDFRGSARNRLKFRSCILGSHCRPEHIGVIAPGCELFQIGQSSSSYGFSIGHSVKMLKRLHAEGSFWVINRAKHILMSDFTFAQAILDDPPPGITLDTNDSGYEYALIGEYLD